MASRTEEDHLWALLTSDEVKSIECSKFIDASPDNTNLPESINSEAAALLKNIKGRIYPIALRGKSQAGKSTTLNRIAKISNSSAPVTELPVGTELGRTCTEGISLMIITFRDNDALLLFDMQGTGLGADEVTHKLIAFTNHVCTKVVDVFRMPYEGFSNDYIDALYCLSIGRYSVTDLIPTSDKAILWTDCVLPRPNPLNKEIRCDTAEKYHIELLNGAVGDREWQAKRAGKYTENMPIFTTKKPSDEISLHISRLDNKHKFIKEEIVPVMKRILENVHPAKYQSKEVKDGKTYMNYLTDIYDKIQANEIILPFSDTLLILRILKDKETWLIGKIEQIKSSYMSNNSGIDKISEELLGELQIKKHECIEQLKDELSNLSEGKRDKQLGELKTFANDKIKEALRKFSRDAMEHYVKGQRLVLSNWCSDQSRIYDKTINLEEQLTSKVTAILAGSVILFHGLKDDTNETQPEEERITEKLKNYCMELCNAQKKVLQDWSNRVNDFERTFRSRDDAKIDQGIDTMIQHHKDYARNEFSRFEIQAELAFDETQKQILKEKIKELSKNWRTRLFFVVIPLIYLFSALNYLIRGVIDLIIAPFNCLAYLIRGIIDLIIAIFNWLIHLIRGAIDWISEIFVALQMSIAIMVSFLITNLVTIIVLCLFTVVLYVLGPLAIVSAGVIIGITIVLPIVFKYFIHRATDRITFIYMDLKRSIHDATNNATDFTINIFGVFLRSIAIVAVTIIITALAGVILTAIGETLVKPGIELIAKKSEKLADQAFQEAVVKAAENVPIRVVVKSTIKIAAHMTKKFPSAAIGIGIGCAAWRIAENSTSSSTYIMAAGEVASGVLGIIPGVGIPASIGVDIVLIVYDVLKAYQMSSPYYISFLWNT